MNKKELIEKVSLSILLIKIIIAMILVKKVQSLNLLSLFIYAFTMLFISTLLNKIFKLIKECIKKGGISNEK